MALVVFYLHMVFNDTSSTKNGLVQECETWLFGSDYGAISGNANMLATFTRLLNNGLDEVTNIVMTADGRWQYDDSNFTDFPIATTNLVISQQDYQLSVSHIKILGVEIKDNNGDWYPLAQIDQQEIRRAGHAITEFMEEDGRPQYYDVVGDSIKLYPAPATANVTTTAGLKVYFQREPDYFTTGDTTQKPGIPSIFHDIPALYASAKYAKSNQMSEKARELDNEITKRTEVLKRFYSKRNVDKKPTLKARYKSAL